MDHCTSFENNSSEPSGGPSRVLECDMASNVNENDTKSQWVFASTLVQK